MTFLLHPLGERIIEELALQGTERILDLGCGDGTLTLQLSRLVPNGEVVGIDVSRGMIAVSEPKRVGNLRFILMDINALAVDREFDLVVSNAALHWVEDHRCLLGNVQRVLCPGALRGLILPEMGTVPIFSRSFGKR